MKLSPTGLIACGLLLVLAGCAGVPPLPESDPAGRWHRDAQGLITRGVSPADGAVESDVERNERPDGIHLARNPASGRVVRKTGMRHEGRCRHHEKKWDQLEDVELYGIPRQDSGAVAGIVVASLVLDGEQSKP